MALDPAVLARRTSRAQSIIDGGTMLSSFMDNPNSKGRVSIGGQMASKAAAGAQMGMAAGPWGAAAGAVIGGVAGLITGKADKQKEEDDAKLMARVDLQNKQQQGANFASMNPEEIYGNKNASYFKLGGTLRKYSEGGKVIMNPKPTGVVTTKRSAAEIAPPGKANGTDNLMNTLGGIIKGIDPTGVTNYPDLYRAIVKGEGNVGVEALASLPMVGKAGKGIKYLETLMKSSRTGLPALKAARISASAMSTEKDISGNKGYLATGTYADGGKLSAYNGHGKQLNSTTVALDGPSHAEGGIDLGGGNEAEGGETVTSQPDGTYVMTNLLGIAKEHKNISRQIGKIENKTMSPERVNALKLLRNKEARLINLQQQLNGNK